MIGIDNLSIVADAPTGSVVGNLWETTLFSDTWPDPIFYIDYAETDFGIEDLFGIDGSTIVTRWDGRQPPPVGFHRVKIGSAQFGFELTEGWFRLFIAAPTSEVLSFTEDNMLVTSISLVEGGPALHVTVGDQNGNALPPSSIQWDQSSVVNIVADATGFNISAVPRSTPTSFNISATDAVQTPKVAGVLAINVTMSAVTALTFSVP
jgi:hypothetical protein